MSDKEEFEKWFQGEQGKPYDGMYMFALAAWQARQPEIDALKAENERLKKDAHGHVEFIKAKAHHLPIEDQHVLAVMLDAAMQEGK